MRFVKMHGTGNDFVMVDARSESAPNWSRLAVAMCDRHFGAGSDGLILIEGDAESGFKMIMYNPDGSEAEMCGNGIRCFARYLFERNEIAAEKVTVETGAGPRWIRVDDPAPSSFMVSVGMGTPDFTPSNVPVNLPGNRIVDHPLRVDGLDLRITALSVGNPHAVAFVEDVTQVPLERIGPMVETNSAFPQKVNFEICQVTGDNSLRMRVWERGAGITLACGTGASATTAAAVATGRARPGAIDLQVDGGVLRMRWEGEGSEIVMTGPAEAVYEGRWLL